MVEPFFATAVNSFATFAFMEAKAGVKIANFDQTVKNR
jgi:hypothetical protein